MAKINVGDATVLKYVDCRDVVVQFSDGRYKSVLSEVIYTVSITD